MIKMFRFWVDGLEIHIVHIYLISIFINHPLFISSTWKWWLIHTFCLFSFYRHNFTDHQAICDIKSSDRKKSSASFILNVSTDKPLDTDSRYNEKNSYNDYLTYTKPYINRWTLIRKMQEHGIWNFKKHIF